MNKIFKIVWNRTIQSFVVTSELAKGHVKASSTVGGAAEEVRAVEQGRLKALFRLTALSMALLGMSEGVWATITERPAREARHSPSATAPPRLTVPVRWLSVTMLRQVTTELWQSVRTPVLLLPLRQVTTQRQSA